MGAQEMNKDIHRLAQELLEEFERLYGTHNVIATRKVAKELKNIRDNADHIAQRNAYFGKPLEGQETPEVEDEGVKRKPGRPRKT